MSHKLLKKLDITLVKPIKSVISVSVNGVTDKTSLICTSRV